jgi:citrate lyase subunit beta/citryl-CoA lyase
MRLRSLLFVPGDQPGRMEKALGAGADALIFDLEDAVTPDRKKEARACVAKFLSREPRPMPLFVRTNPLAVAR